MNNGSILVLTLALAQLCTKGTFVLERGSLFGERRQRPIKEGVVVERNIDKVDRFDGTGGGGGDGGGDGRDRRAVALDDRPLFDGGQGRFPRSSHAHPLALVVRRARVAEEPAAEVAQPSRQPRQAESGRGVSGQHAVGSGASDAAPRLVQSARRIHSRRVDHAAAA